MFFRKKCVTDLIVQDRELIDSAEKLLDVITTKVKDESVVKETNETKEMIHFLAPSIDKKVISMDQEIKKTIDDFVKDVITEKLNIEKMLKRITDIKVLVAQRNSRA